jgi:hypothetical protein
MNAKSATFDLLDHTSIGEVFTGLVLARCVGELTKEYHYPATTLRYMRQWRAIRGRKVECINKPRSMYEVVG